MPFLIPLKRIPIWTNWRRRRYLDQFQSRVEGYFAAVRYEAFPFRVVENEEAASLRRTLEPELSRCRAIVHAAGKVPLVRLAPGEREGQVVRVNLITEAFELYRYNLGREDLLDVLERARAVYGSDGAAAWLRTLNPLYWLEMFLSVMEMVPFLLLRVLRLRWRDAAASLPGRLVRLVVRAATLVVLALCAIRAAGLQQEALDAAGRLYRIVAEIPARFMGS